VLSDFIRPADSVHCALYQLTAHKGFDSINTIEINVSI